MSFSVITLQNLRFFKVCWSVSFFCLHSVFERCTGHNTGPIVLILCQLVYSGPRTMANFVSENRPGNFFFAMETNRSMMRDRDFSILWYFISRLLVDISL